MPLEGIDLFDGEFAFAERLNALHYVEQPTTRFRRRIPEEKRFLPFRKDQLFLANQTLLHDMNLAGLRTRLSRMFDPIHPARRAVGANGFRSSMISRTKKCLGTMNRLTTASDFKS